MSLRAKTDALTSQIGFIAWKSGGHVRTMCSPRAGSIAAAVMFATLSAAAGGLAIWNGLVPLICHYGICPYDSRRGLAVLCAVCGLLAITVGLGLCRCCKGRVMQAFAPLVPSPHGISARVRLLWPSGDVAVSFNRHAAQSTPFSRYTPQHHSPAPRL